MKHNISFIVSMILSGILNVTSAAEVQLYQTSKGNSVLIGKFSRNLQKDCSIGPIPWIHITKKPLNGSLNTDTGDFTKENVNATGNYQCIGKPAKGVMLYYTPNRGFVGTDHVEFDVEDQTTGKHKNALNNAHTVEITVH